MSDDLSHDAHLRAALRHAPDHALVPPSGVSQSILAAARHVHRPARPVTPAPPVRVTVAPPRYISLVLRWFSSPRWAGGLATGLVAALGVGLWLDLGTQPVIDRPEVPAPSAPPAASPQPGAEVDTLRSQPAVEPASQAPTATAPAPELIAPPVGRAAGRDDSDAATAARSNRDSAVPRPPSARGESQALAQPGVRGGSETRAEPKAKARAKSDGEAADHAPAATSPAPAGPVAPTPRLAGADRPAAPTESDAVPASAAGAAAGALAQQKAERASASQVEPEAATAPRRLSEEALAKSASQAAARNASPAGLTSNLAAGTAVASPALTLLRRARAEQAAGSAHWEWQRPGALAPTAFDDAAQAWLVQVIQTARGQWLEAGERAGTGEALEVRWWRDGWPHATLRIEAEGLRWIEQSGRVRYAPLDAAALQRLRAL
jgi:hypothetical protein